MVQEQDATHIHASHINEFQEWVSMTLPSLPEWKNQSKNHLDIKEIKLIKLDIPGQENPKLEWEIWSENSSPEDIDRAIHWYLTEQFDIDIIAYQMQVRYCNPDGFLKVNYRLLEIS